MSVRGPRSKVLGPKSLHAAVVALTLFTWDLGPGTSDLLAQAPRGKAVYDKWCAGCHGDTGAGDGPAAAYMLPRPRDFTRGVYKIRSTASGEIPTDGDLRHVIDEGMPATAMPDWKELLDERERDDLVAYVKSFYDQFASSQARPLQFGNAPGSSDASIDRKSTRLNSSHANISYAVFCLKKKKRLS